ncbi:helix-turn-helix transcriptional regulator [bacterium]|nr:helix-turn-helix transcriptional regulator [bacterium]
MENKVCSILGENIKKLRKARGITQNELAEMISLDVKSLSLIETGKGFASAKTLEKLTSVLKISVGDLFNSENEQNQRILYSEILSNLKLIKNSTSKLQTVNIVIKSLV